MTIKFVSDTGLTATIPNEGHKAEDPDGVEGSRVTQHAATAAATPERGQFSCATTRWSLAS